MRQDFAEAREALDHVVDVLNTGSPGAVALWNILTALRGPDSGDGTLKHKTTTNLRGKIGLIPPADYGIPVLGKNFVSAIVTHAKPALLDRQGPNTSPHFRRHYNNAVRALRSLEYTLSEPEE